MQPAKKALSVALLFGGSALASHQTELASGLGLDFSGCSGTYQESVNLLYMNCVDKNGVLVDRYQRLYVKPLVSETGQVDSSTLMQGSGTLPPVDNSTANATVNSNSTTTSGNFTLPNYDGTNTTVQTNSTITNMGGDNSTAETPADETPAEEATPTEETPEASGSASMVSCKDYYQKGSGYEFSVCDTFGAIMRPEMFGGQKDLFYLNETMYQSGV